MAMQIRRTVSNGPPTGLAEGQLAVEMDSATLWVGVPTSVDPSGRKLVGARSITIIDTLNNTGELPATGNPGDGYLIDGDLWVYDATATPIPWRNIGRIQGPPGQDGAPGTPGTPGVNGADGADGADGAAATIAVGSVTAGSPLSITNSGDSHDAVFDFVIPSDASGTYLPLTGGHIDGSLSIENDLTVNNRVSAEDVDAGNLAVSLGATITGNLTASGLIDGNIFPRIYTFGVVGRQMNATIPGWTLANRGVFILIGNLPSEVWGPWTLNINNLGARPVHINDAMPFRQGWYTYPGPGNNPPAIVNRPRRRFADPNFAPTWHRWVNDANTLSSYVWDDNNTFMILRFDGTVFVQVENATLWDKLSEIQYGVSPRFARHTTVGSGEISMSPNPIKMVLITNATGTQAFHFKVSGMAPGHLQPFLRANPWNVHNRRLAGQTRKLIFKNRYNTSPTIRFNFWNQTYYVPGTASVWDSPMYIPSSLRARLSRRLRTGTNVTVGANWFEFPMTPYGEAELVYRINHSGYRNAQWRTDQWVQAIAFPPTTGISPNGTVTGWQTVVDFLDLHILEYL